MKGIKFCGECGYYSYKLHKCTNGAIDEGNAKDPFYADCPLDDVAKVVRCKDCMYQRTADGFYACHKFVGANVSIITNPNNYCSLGRRKENGI